MSSSSSRPAISTPERRVAQRRGTSTTSQGPSSQTSVTDARPALAESAAESSNGVAAVQEQFSRLNVSEGSRNALFVGAGRPRPADLEPNALRCPFCSTYASNGPARGLMRHISCRHAGRLIDDSARQLLSALERGVCPASGCGALRPISSRVCSRCACSAPARPLIAGDRVPAQRQRQQNALAPAGEPT